MKTRLFCLLLFVFYGCVLFARQIEPVSFISLVQTNNVIGNLDCNTQGLYFFTSDKGLLKYDLGGRELLQILPLHLKIKIPVTTESGEKKLYEYDHISTDSQYLTMLAVNSTGTQLVLILSFINSQMNEVQLQPYIYDISTKELRPIVPAREVSVQGDKCGMKTSQTKLEWHYMSVAWEKDDKNIIYLRENRYLQTIDFGRIDTTNGTVESFVDGTMRDTIRGFSSPIFFNRDNGEVVFDCRLNDNYKASSITYYLKTGRWKLNPKPIYHAVWDPENGKFYSYGLDLNEIEPDKFTACKRFSFKEEGIKAGLELYDKKLYSSIKDYEDLEFIPRSLVWIGDTMYFKSFKGNIYGLQIRR